MSLAGPNGPARLRIRNLEVFVYVYGVRFCRGGTWQPHNVKHDAREAAVRSHLGPGPRSLTRSVQTWHIGLAILSNPDTRFAFAHVPTHHRHETRGSVLVRTYTVRPQRLHTRRVEVLV